MDKILTGIKFIGGAAAVIGVLYFVLSYVDVVKQNGTLQASVTKWEDKHKTAVQAQEDTEFQNHQLKQDYDSLQEDLLTWRDKWENVDKEKTRLQRRVRALEAENEEIRDTLAIRIPPRLWCEIFPTSRHFDCDEIRNQATSSSLAPGIPGP